MTALSNPSRALSSRQIGTHANRPAAGAVRAGFLYYEIDTTDLLESDGSSTWTNVGSGDVSAAIAAEVARANAAYVPSDPVLVLTYDGDDLATVTENGVVTTFTSNVDGTIATSQRGTGPVRSYTYVDGNLTAVS